MKILIDQQLLKYSYQPIGTNSHVTFKAPFQPILMPSFIFKKPSCTSSFTWHQGVHKSVYMTRWFEPSALEHGKQHAGQWPLRSSHEKHFHMPSFSIKKIKCPYANFNLSFVFIKYCPDVSTYGFNKRFKAAFWNIVKIAHVFSTSKTNWENWENKAKHSERWLAFVQTQRKCCRDDGWVDGP